MGAFRWGVWQGALLCYAVEPCFAARVRGIRGRRAGRAELGGEVARGTAWAPGGRVFDLPFVGAVRVNYRTLSYRAGG